MYFSFEMAIRLFNFIGYAYEDTKGKKSLKHYQTQILGFHQRLLRSKCKFKCKSNETNKNIALEIDNDKNENEGKGRKNFPTMEGLFLFFHFEGR